jgi:hypothetical protein
MLINFTTITNEVAAARAGLPSAREGKAGNERNR